MATISDYASLTSAIGTWTKRAAQLTAGANPISDQFIQSAQASIERDIPDLNFGNYIKHQEAAYGPFAISNGVCPVPADWLGPKLLNIQDNAGNTDLLVVKAAAWIYDAYPQRTTTGVPAYVARDRWQSSYAQVSAFTATDGQQVFTLPFTPSSSTMLLVSLDGASLSPSVSYSISGTTLTLGSPASAGQVLAVQYLSTFSSTQNWTVNSAQSTFALSNGAASVIAVTLDGAILVSGTDYNVSGGYIQLTTTPTAGQVLVAYLAMGSVLIFGPYPDSGYVVGGTYYQSAPVLSYSNATTANWMSQRFPDGFLAACMREAATLLEDVNMYSRWDGIYQQRLKALVDQDKAERWAASTMQVELG